MTNPFFGNMPQQKGVAPQAAPSGTNSLNNDIDPIKRAKFTGYLQGMSANAVPPQPPQPPMMPQPPMPMNMGGMVDVFDPMYMNQGGFVISTDDSGKIRTRPVFDEDKGRMVSQILSRDMVDDMANQAAMLKTRQSPPIADTAIIPSLGEIISEKIIEEKMLDNAQRADDSLKGVPDFTTTTIEPETATISMPTPKPKIDIDMLRVGEDTDTSIALPKRKPIQLSVSKPKIDEPVFRTMLKDFYSDRHGGSGAIDDISTDALKSLMPTNKELISDQVASVISDETEDVSDPQTVTDFILGRGDAVFDTPTLGNLSRNVMARRLIEDDLPPISDSMPDRVIGLLDRLYNPGLQADKEEQGIGLLAKILNALRPQFTTESAGFEEIGGGEKFPPSTALRSSRFNDGGIVQGFVAGGDVIKDMDVFERPEKTISSNISGNVGGRSDDDDLRRDEDISFIDGKEVESTGPVYDAFLKSQESMFAPIVNKIGESVFGKSPYDLYYTTQQNLKPDSMQSRLARDRLKDQESAERKLAEEQRLRDMIAGMMPKTEATPAPPMVTAPDAPTADPATPDYSSVVVPSDRVPGFDVGNISPFPQFRMPTEFTPVFPESLSANYFRDLFKNIGVNKMQEGGAVNQLDSAIDNFINAYR